MKIKITALLVLVALLFCGCGAKAYFLGDVLPELMDITTQYPNVESVTVGNIASGETLTYTDAGMQDNIRMLFEGVQCTRTKSTAKITEAVYTVTFNAIGESTVIYVISGSEYVIGEYTYKAITFGVDMVYLENLFA